MSRKTLGIVRKLDKLNRLVIPKEYVKELKLPTNAKMEIIYMDGVLQIKPYEEDK